MAADYFKPRSFLAKTFDFAFNVELVMWFR